MLRFGTPADKELVESICNHPDVRKWTAYQGAPLCNADRYLRAPCMTMIANGGCFLGVALGEGRYEVHTNFIEVGRNALRAGYEAAEIMFTQTDCVELVTKVPTNNPQAKWFAQALGCRYLFTRDEIWRSGAAMHDMEYFSLSVDDWILRGHCGADGAQFHEKLESLGEHVDHASDPVHDYYVGAALKMILNGQARKAETVYTRWARFAGYVAFKILAESPVTVDIGTCTLIYDNGSLTIEGKDHA